MSSEGNSNCRPTDGVVPDPAGMAVEVLFLAPQRLGYPSRIVAASSPDGPSARSAPAGDWPSRGSSRVPWARPASGAGWPPCWPADRPAANSTAGAGDSAGRVRITGRNDGTCVVGFGSWVAPKSKHTHVPVKVRPFRRRPQEENPQEENPQQKKRIWQKGGRRPSRRRPPSSNRLIQRTFRTAMTMRACRINTHARIAASSTMVLVGAHSPAAAGFRD